MMQTDTQTPTLETLLRRWAELEPDRCDMGPALQYAKVKWGDFRLSVCDYRMWPIGIQHIYAIQAAVQEAIEARGMWWALDNDVVDKKYAAVVNERRWGNLDWYGFSDDTPAAALLSAYLQALEAQR